MQPRRLTDSDQGGRNRNRGFELMKIARSRCLRRSLFRIEANFAGALSHR
jgi:hypothetical protein